MKTRRGMGLIELVVAVGIFMAFLVVTTAVMDFIGRSSLRTRAKLEPRQQIRNFLRALDQDLRGASYLFTGYTGTLLASSVQTPTEGGPATSSLLFAVPRDSTDDAEYLVCLAFARARSNPDPNNPNAREVVYHRFEPMHSPVPNVPGAINPANLMGGSSRTYDVYLPVATAGDPGLSIRVYPNGEAVSVQIKYRYQPPRGSVQSEEYHSIITLRNNV